LGVFLVPLPNYLSPSGCHFIVKVKFLALLSDLKEKKSGYGDVSKYYEVHTAHTLQSANNIFCKAHHIKF
jgi:hypothetical protein